MKKLREGMIEEKIERMMKKGKIIDDEIYEQVKVDKNQMMIENEKIMEIKEGKRIKK